MRESHRILFLTFCENPVFVDLMAASYQYFHPVFRVSDGRGFYARRVQLTSQCTQPSGVRVACTLPAWRTDTPPITKSRCSNTCLILQKHWQINAFFEKKIFRCVFSCELIEVETVTLTKDFSLKCVAGFTVWNIVPGLPFELPRYTFVFTAFMSLNSFVFVWCLFSFVFFLSFLCFFWRVRIFWIE